MPNKPPNIKVVNSKEEIEDYHSELWERHKVKLTKPQIGMLLDGKSIMFHNGEYSFEITLEET